VFRIYDILTKEYAVMDKSKLPLAQLMQNLLGITSLTTNVSAVFTHLRYLLQSGLPSQVHY